MTIKERLAAWYAERFLSFKEGWSKFTVKWNLVLISAGTFWILLPNDVQTQIVDTVLGFFGVPTSWTIVVIGVVGLYFRLKKQDPKE